MKHKPSEEECTVAHWKDVNRTILDKACVRCSVCRRFIRPENMDYECDGERKGGLVEAEGRKEGGE